MTVTRDELIARALAFPAAVEDYPFGDDLLTVKVGRRVLAWIPLNEFGWLGHGGRVAVRLPPRRLPPRRPPSFTAHTGGQVHAARPLDERYWLTIPIGATIPDREVADLLAASYDEGRTAATKKQPPRPQRSARQLTGALIAQPDRLPGQAAPPRRSGTASGDDHGVCVPPGRRTRL